MKIVHFCLSCFYIDGYAYQENQLAAQHVKDGHDVTIIASTETYNSARQTEYIEPSEYMGSDGARVIRLPYRAFLPAKVARKVRAYPQVRKLLDAIKPDAILFHGLCAWELRTVAKYVKDNPLVKLYADCHEDFNNSARDFASEHLLHRGFYRSVLQSALPQIREVLCVTVESIEFARDVYGVPADKLHLYPLAGHIHSDTTYNEYRTTTRTLAGATDSDTIIVQSGKITASKLLPQALKSFIQTPGEHLKFWVVGQIVDQAEECNELIASDQRISYMGWRSPEELEKILCAADVYLQPWGQTATTQMSMCCRCATILEDLPSHRALFADNGFLLNEQRTMAAAFAQIAESPQAIEEMKARSFEFAQEHLDYERLAKRIYQ